MVTHNLPLVGRQAALIVSVSSNGIATVRDTIEEVIEIDPALKPEVTSRVEQADDLAEKTKDEKATISSGKLIADEEVALGHVNTASSEYTSS